MSEEMKKCPFCGEEILAMAIKCKHCQSMLNGELHPHVDPVGKNIRFTPGMGVNIGATDYFKGTGAVILALVAIFFTGWLYVWACSIPFVFWLMPMIYGCLTGVFMFLAMRFFRSNDIGVFITLGLLGVIVAYYANWVWFVHDIYDQFILSPGDLWSRIWVIQRIRQIDIDAFISSRRAMLTIDGWMLMLAWLLEFIMILGGVAAGIYISITEQAFFCPWCKRWNDVNSKPYKLASDKPEYELTSIEAIMEMTRPADEESDHYTVTVFKCPHCKNGTFSLAAMKAVLKSGKYEFEKTTLLNRIPCPADKLEELKEFITISGIECKK